MNRGTARVVEFDVRPQLRNKVEPFQLIMDQVKELEEDDIFVLHATIRPTPLMGILKMKGLVGISERVEEGHWMTTFVHSKNEHWLEELASTEDNSSIDSSEILKNEGCRGIK